MRHLLYLAVLLLAACKTTAPTRPAAHAAHGPRVTEPFRQGHVELHEHLDHVDGWLRELPAQAPDERAATQARVVKFFEEHLLPHAGWEEEQLYPAVDRRASQGEPFTASMRFEHTVVGRRVDALRALATQDDPAEFTRQADQLLGLVITHFEAEEEVLLPVLDRTMTPEEYERELGAGAAHH